MSGWLYQIMLNISAGGCNGAPLANILISNGVMTICLKENNVAMTNGQYRGVAAGCTAAARRSENGEKLKCAGVEAWLRRESAAAARNIKPRSLAAATAPAAAASAKRRNGIEGEEIGVMKRK